MQLSFANLIIHGIEMNRNNSILYIAIVFYFLLSISDISSEEINNRSSKVFRYVKNDTYGYGEKLTYDIGYKFIKAGEGSFEIMPKPLYFKGRECYDVRFKVKSLESLEWLYKVRDQYRTLLDVQGIFPWKFFQRIHEGNYKRDFEAEFDQVNNLAITKKKTYHTAEYVHDIVSAFYYVRTLDLNKLPKDSVLEMQNFWDDSTYTLGVKLVGTETIEVKAGIFDCVIVEPLISEGGLFMSEGKILIWLSNDERKIPVKVATKILIGYIDAELTSYKGLRGPLKAKR